MPTPSENKLRTTLLHLLTRREHTKAELLRKLTAKGFSSEDIEPLLQEFSEKGLLSHNRFIENYIHSRTRKGYGPLRIQAELLERGLKEDFIEHHLNISDNAWLSAVRIVWQKKFKGQKPKDFKGKAQQMRFLHYRGFTPEQIDSLFNNEGCD